MKWTAVVGFGERLLKDTEGMGVLFLTLFTLTLCAVPNTPNLADADRRLCDRGEITPLVPFVLDTQDIILECVSQEKAKNLSFQIGTDPPVNEKYIVKRNETYVKLVIPNVSKQNVSEYGIRRFVRCLDIDTKKCVDNTYIMLEYYPRPVQDDVCVMRDFKELFCNWSLGVPPYKFLRDINVTSEFAFMQTTWHGHSPLKWFSCQNGTKQSCNWSPDSLMDKGLFLKIAVRFNVTNTFLNVSKVTEKYYLRDDIVLPSPVKNLTYDLTEDPTCVLLTWRQISMGRHFKHNISFHSDCDLAEQSTLEHTECSKLNCYYRLCGLLPSTAYHGSVVIRYFPDGKERGHWSSPAYIEFMTRKAVPKKNPSVTAGLYIWQTDGIILYWQPLTSCEIHSNDTWYEVEMNGVKKKYPWTEFQRKMSIPRSCETEDCAISILAANDIGKAAGITTLDINPQKEVPKDSTLIVEFMREEGKEPQFFAEIRIDKDNLQHFENITHTLTWCKSMSAIGCKEPIKWLEDVVAGKGIPIPVANGSKEHEFGLITKGYSKKLRKIVSTDIHLVQCIYLYNTAPRKPLPGVNLAEAILPNSLTVEWEGYECQKSVIYLQNSVPYVENYVLTFCQSEQPAANGSCVCLNQATEVSVSRTLTVYTMEDLMPVGYCVWVSANNSHGLGPRNRNSLFYMVTDGNASNSNNVMAIVSGVVLSVIVVIVVAWFLVKRTREWVKARVEMVIPQIQGDPPPEIPLRHYIDNPLCTEDRSVTETSLHWVSDRGDEGVFEDSRSPLLGYDIAENIECGSNMSLNTLLSHAQDYEDTKHSSIDDISVSVNSAINVEGLYGVPGAKPEGLGMVSYESNIDSDPLKEISGLEKEVSEVNREYGENIDVNSGDSFDESFSPVEKLNDSNMHFNENTYPDGVSATEMNISNLQTGLEDLKSCDSDEAAATDTNSSNLPTGSDDIRLCDNDQNDSKNTSKMDDDCEFIDWNVGNIAGYRTIPLTDPCSKVSEDSDFNGSPQLQHRDTSEPDMLPQVTNNVSTQSNKFVVSSESKDHDSAVFLSDNYTYNLSDNSTDDSIQRDLSVTCNNIFEDTKQSTDLSAVSLPTSDYQGSDDQKVESVKVTKEERKEIVNLEDEPAEPKKGYSQAKHLEI